MNVLQRVAMSGASRCFWVLLIASFLIIGCARKNSGQFQGYIEGDYLYISSPVGGTLEKLLVSRGQQVAKGDLVFVLEHQSEQAALNEAGQRKLEADARLANLLKGKRPSEIEAIQKRYEQAKAGAAYWTLEFQRNEELFRSNVVAVADVDQARFQRDSAVASAASVAAELETAGLGAREDEIKAAEAAVSAASAAQRQAEWVVGQKSQFAQATGLIQDTLYVEGEWVAPGAPVVSLLAPENLKARFFVPETIRSQILTGSRVRVTADGHPSDVAATVTYISSRAEYTPPVIYSREARAKLVYMVEASFSPEDARTLSPGQPVDVELAP